MYIMHQHLHVEHDLALAMTFLHSRMSLFLMLIKRLLTSSFADLLGGCKSQWMVEKDTPIQWAPEGQTSPHIFS